MKYVKHLSSEELLERMADELVMMHNDTAIELQYWETAKEIVERFYYIESEVVVHGKRN